MSIRHSSGQRSLRFSPRDSVRIFLKLPDYSNYIRIYISWKFGENRSISFWERTVESKQSDKNTDFVTQWSKWDLSCLSTVQNEIFQKCRKTIPLVQVCFKF